MRLTGEIEEKRQADLSVAIENTLDNSVLTDERLHDVVGCVADTIGHLYYAIYHIWLDTHEFLCFRESPDDLGELIGHSGVFESAWEAYVNNYVYPEDRSAMREFAMNGVLKSRLREIDVISHEYHRKDVGWTRGQFIVGRRNKDGSPSHVVYAVSDINEEKRLMMSDAEALFELQHDSLTGTLNRKSFDDAMAHDLAHGNPVGFLLLDIDQFKEYNDEHGHALGDKVLSLVAKELLSVFREGDHVYRIGGDEFAVFLHGCDDSCWDALCRKIKRIHADLADELMEGVDITLSAGVCFNATGLAPWMYKAADEGMYNTKRNGRAGCTKVDKQGKPLQLWRDDNASFETSAALKGTSSGTGRVEFRLDHTSLPRFICGKTLSSMYGLPVDATPEENFAIWAAGVDSSDYVILNEAVDKMIQGVTVEVTFRWKRPDGNQFLVRTVGSGKIEDGLATIFGFHRSLEHAQVVSFDGTLMMGVVEDATLIHEEGRSVADLCDNVPGGLVIYEWNGEHLKILHVSKHYASLYGEKVQEGYSSGA